MLTALRRSLAAVLLIPAAALGPGACGEGDERDVQALLDRAFKQPLESMDVKLDAELNVQGIEELERPLRIQASGPYRAGDGGLPTFDIDVALSAGGAGQVISTGALSTGDRSFVKFEDDYYEVDSPESPGSRRERNRCRKEGIGIDARPWVRNANDEGEERVAGVQTTHVSGTLDVGQALGDLNRFVDRCGRLLGAATGGIPEALSGQDIEQVSKVVKDPSFDVYVAIDDETIRRLSASIEFELPEEDREADGVEGGSLRFSLEFTDVNGDQRIEAPARSHPLSELTSLLRGTGILGGDGEEPQSGETEAEPDLEEFQGYADCLDQAEPDDAEAIARCDALLEPR